MSKNGKKLLWLLLALAAAVGLILCLYFLFRPKPAVELPTPPIPEVGSASEESQTEHVEIPVDFPALQAENPDIYAWIQIPGTEINYPILQRFGDNDYYLRRDVEGNYSQAGTLFTQFQYNVTDFSDPVTVVYGHDMDDGSMFGSLQHYCSSLSLDDSPVFYIYQPGRRLTYQIFAAIPYDNSHILYYHNFHDEAVFEDFFADIYGIRSLYANVAPEDGPSPEDKVVILSTCLEGDNTKRFLVMGVLTEDVASVPS